MVYDNMVGMLDGFLIYSRDSLKPRESNKSQTILRGTRTLFLLLLISLKNITYTIFVFIDLKR